MFKQEAFHLLYNISYVFLLYLYYDPSIDTLTREQFWTKPALLKWTKERIKSNRSIQHTLATVLNWLWLKHLTKWDLTWKSSQIYKSTASVHCTTLLKILCIDTDLYRSISLYRSVYILCIDCVRRVGITHTARGKSYDSWSGGLSIVSAS